MYSDSPITIKTAGQDIQIGYDTGSGDVQIDTEFPTLVNGILPTICKISSHDHDTAARDGLAGLVDGQNNLTHPKDLEVYVGGVWKMQLQLIEIHR